jgi:hypothetical protein
MEQTRQPVVAGMFYFLDSGNLNRQLSGFFSKAKTEIACNCVISPHAGYEYSGLTATYAISSLKLVNDFIILGPNHTGLGSEFSIMSDGVWETPLGKCRINKAIATELKKCKILEEDINAHLEEHSIEVQLPFLQYRFKEFSFVPICIMNIDYSHKFLEKCELLGRYIVDLIKKDNIGVIASTDFSHFLPLDIARDKDEKAIKKIEKLDLKGFFKTLEETSASICGYGPIAVLISVAKTLSLKPQIIHQSSSGDASGDFGSVVTYYAIGFL